MVWRDELVYLLFSLLLDLICQNDTYRFAFLFWFSSSYWYIYVVEKTITESPVYDNIKNVPGLSNFHQSISEKLAVQFYQILIGSINSLLKEDPIFDQYLEVIISKLGQTVELNSSTEKEINHIEELLIVLLEEIKINYVQKIAQEEDELSEVMLSKN